MKRGIVTSPCVYGFYTGQSIVAVGQQLTCSDINYYCLYWDEMVILDSANISMPVPKQRELVENGILKRPKLIVDGMLNIADFPRLYSNFQIETLNELRKNEKATDWLLHQSGTEFSFGDYERAKEQIRLELMNALPIPKDDVTVSDILEYKYKFSDEFNALHLYIEELYFDILKSPDQELTKRKSYSRLTDQINDIDKICREKWQIPVRFDLSTNFEIDGEKLSELLKTAISTFTPVSLFGGGTAGALGAVATSTALSFINIKPVWVGFNTGKENKLAYISQASKHKIV
ncbi:TPA: DUF6236 family protein [Enterobacter ludwigii]